MNRLDVCLQAVCPTIMVPQYGEFVPLAAHGHRFLCACDGLYLEVERPWLHLVTQIAASQIPLPYGRVDEVTEFNFNGSLAAHIVRFITSARDALPNEHAAWLAYDPASSGFEYLSPETLSVSGSHIRYQRPAPAEGHVLAVDIHSHGKLPAFFSGEDNLDASDDAKLEIVVGSLDKSIISMSCRLTACGTHHDLSEWLASLLYSQNIEITTVTATCHTF